MEVYAGVGTCCASVEGVGRCSCSRSSWYCHLWSCVAGWKGRTMLGDFSSLERVDWMHQYGRSDVRIMPMRDLRSRSYSTRGSEAHRAAALLKERRTFSCILFIFSSGWPVFHAQFHEIRNHKSSLVLRLRARRLEVSRIDGVARGKRGRKTRAKKS